MSFAAIPHAPWKKRSKGCWKARSLIRRWFWNDVKCPNPRFGKVGAGRVAGVPEAGAIPVMDRAGASHIAMGSHRPARGLPTRVRGAVGLLGRGPRPAGLPVLSHRLHRVVCRHPEAGGVAGANR